MTVSTAAESRYSRFFDNATLRQIERMRLRPLRRLTNRSRGEHLSGKGGSSTDFADYRNYAVGDDLRYVDWNIFARLRRPFIKQFQHEEEMHVVLLIDASTSMLSGNKLLRAQQFAAAFGIMGMLNLERVSVYGIHTAGVQPTLFPPSSGRTKIRPLLKFLEQLEGGGAIPLEQSIETMLRFHRGRGVAVLLSDFLTLGDLSRPFNMLYSAGLEPWGLQILSEAEVSPDVQGDLRFVDSETGETLDITNAAELLGEYAEQLRALQRYLDNQCRRRQGRFLSISTGEGFELQLKDRLCRQGWVLR